MNNYLRGILAVYALFISLHVFSQDQSSSNSYQSTQNPSIESDSYVFTDSKNVARFSIGGGYARRLGKVLKSGNNAMDQLSESLRDGFAIEADLHIYPTFTSGKTNLEPAINFNYIRSSASMNFFNRYKETQSTIYIGPALSVCSDHEKWLFTGSIG